MKEVVEEMKVSYEIWNSSVMDLLDWCDEASILFYETQDVTDGEIHSNLT